jgi:hypothetical protein
VSSAGTRWPAAQPAVAAVGGELQFTIKGQPVVATPRAAPTAPRDPGSVDHHFPPPLNGNIVSQTPMTPAEVRRRIAASLSETLGGFGFRGQKGFVLRERSPIVTDWLAVTAVGRQGGSVDVGINVGVHCTPLHRLLAEIEFSRYSETDATFSTNIGYLEPAHCYRQWKFTADDPEASVHESIVDAVATVALSFLERFSDYPSVREGCQMYGLVEYNLLRIPALAWLAGDRDESRVLLNSGLAVVAARSDPAALGLRKAAQNLLTRC